MVIGTIQISTVSSMMTLELPFFPLAHSNPHSFAHPIKWSLRVGGGGGGCPTFPMIPLLDNCCCLGAALKNVSTSIKTKLQGSAKRLRPGLVNFVGAVAYHFFLSLPAAFTQPGRSFLADPCI